jgi:hypothetical protein
MIQWVNGARHIGQGSSRIVTPPEGNVGDSRSTIASAGDVSKIRSVIETSSVSKTCGCGNV